MLPETRPRSLSLSCVTVSGITYKHRSSSLSCSRERTCPLCPRYTGRSTANKSAVKGTIRGGEAEELHSYIPSHHRRPPSPPPPTGSGGAGKERSRSATQCSSPTNTRAYRSRPSRHRTRRVRSFPGPRRPATVDKPTAADQSPMILTNIPRHIHRPSPAGSLLARDPCP